MSKKYNTEEIIAKFKQIHGNKYDYSKFIYKTRITKSTIICPIHGEFLQSRFHHENGSGCPDCAGVPRGGFKKTSQEDFNNKIKNKFGDLYDFSKFVYNGVNTKGIVICLIHGEFLKSPKKLYNGQGCPHCSGKAKLSKEILQKKIDELHGRQKYDLSKFDYINNKTKGIIICEKHGEWLARPDNLINLGHACPRCAIGSSKAEEEIKEFLKSIGIKNIIEKNKSILDNYELDLYLPDYNLAIEYNGLYWHSELNGGKNSEYHLNKTRKCDKLQINLLHIFEDEWIHKKEIWKSIIKYKLNKIDNKLYARKCHIKEINHNICNPFLEQNHLQGRDKSSIKLGLYYNDELVSVLTLGNSRINKNYQWEIFRFCSKLETNILGGFSKLLNYFIKKYNPISILTYANKRYSVGNLYKINGFSEIGDSPPNYFYFKKHELIRYSRWKLQKHKLKTLLPIFVEELSEWDNIKLNGEYDRIWDCGNKVFVWNTNII